MITGAFLYLPTKIVVLLNVSLLLKYVAGDSAWFQVCDRKHKYALSSVDCKLGLWLTEPLKTDCVCVNGVWIVSEDLCDKNAMIVVGNGDCFALNKPIRSIKLLGRPDDPFSPASYVTDEYFDSFVKIPKDGYNRRLESHSSFIISIFPEKALRRSDHEVCLENTRSHSPVQIWKNSRRVSTRFKFLDSSKCDTTVPYDFHVRFGEIYKDSEVLYGDTVKQQCSNKCVASPQVMNQKHARGRSFGRVASSSRAASPKTKASKASPPRNTRWENLYNLNPKIEFEHGEALSPEERASKMNMYNFRWNMTLPALSHSREVREQSVRMIQAQTNFLLLNQSPPKINTPEYDYFQKFRQIFVGIVPNDIIPHEIVNGLMRMFRLVLWESHDKFQYQESPNMEQYGRIMSGLNECLWNVTAYPFVFTGNLSANATQLPNSTHGCVEQTRNVYWNSSDQFGLAPGVINYLYTDKNLADESLAGSPREDFNVTKYDFAIELAWKIYLFGYYRCYDYFTQTATDGHELAERVQSLFNHRVVKRWYNPEDFNKVLPLIFPKLNLTQFAWAVDKMVVGARESTEWETLLARRPIPMTQDDIPDSDASSQREKRSGKHRREGTFWSNRAHCMLSFLDPIKEFKYAGRQGCYISELR